MYCARLGDWKSQGRSAKTTTEVGKRLSMGGTLEVAESAKITTEAEKRLSMGGGRSATKIRLNGEGGAVKTWFKGEGVHKIVNLEK